MNAEREGLQSARPGVSYGPHAEPVVDQPIERRAAKSPMRRKPREIKTAVEAEPATPHVRYGAGF